MHFPLIPLPAFLATKILLEAHVVIAGYVSIFGVFIGAFLLMLWGWSHPEETGAWSGTTAREYNRIAFGFLGLAVLAGTFGLYLVLIPAIAVGAFVAFVIGYPIINGFRVAFGKRTDRRFGGKAIWL